MIKPENFRFRALFGRTAFLSYKDGASVGGRTRTEGVGGIPILPNFIYYAVYLTYFA